MKGLLVLVLVASFACTAAPSDPTEVEDAARRFLDYVHTYDYEAMRAAATGDFEILIFGLRLDMDGFEDFIQGMEERLEGRELASYDLVGLNTRIVGDVAYTSWSSTNWLESAIFVRSGEQWLMDRAASVRITRDER